MHRCAVLDVFGIQCKNRTSHSMPNRISPETAGSVRRKHGHCSLFEKHRHDLNIAIAKMASARESEHLNRKNSTQANHG